MSKKEKTNKGIPIYRIIILIALILIIVLIGYMVKKTKVKKEQVKTINNKHQNKESKYQK